MKPKMKTRKSSNGIELYDYGAGKLIAKEAGAKVVDFTGKKETDYSNASFIIVIPTKSLNMFLV